MSEQVMPKYCSISAALCMLCYASDLYDKQVGPHRAKLDSGSFDHLLAYGFACQLVYGVKLMKSSWLKSNICVV